MVRRSRGSSVRRSARLLICSGNRVVTGSNPVRGVCLKIESSGDVDRPICEARVTPEKNTDLFGSPGDHDPMAPAAPAFGAAGISIPTELQNEVGTFPVEAADLYRRGSSKLQDAYHNEWDSRRVNHPLRRTEARAFARLGTVSKSPRRTGSIHRDSSCSQSSLTTLSSTCQRKGWTTQIMEGSFSPLA